MAHHDLCDARPPRTSSSGNTVLPTPQPTSSSVAGPAARSGNSAAPESTRGRAAHGGKGTLAALGRAAACLVYFYELGDDCDDCGGEEYVVPKHQLPALQPGCLLALGQPLASWCYPPRAFLCISSVPTTTTTNTTNTKSLTPTFPDGAFIPVPAPPDRSLHEPLVIPRPLSCSGLPHPYGDSAGP
jgi:hypothetical protein